MTHSYLLCLRFIKPCAWPSFWLSNMKYEIFVLNLSYQGSLSGFDFSLIRSDWMLVASSNQVEFVVGYHLSAKLLWTFPFFVFRWLFSSSSIMAQLSKLLAINSSSWKNQAWKGEGKKEIILISVFVSSVQQNFEFLPSLFSKWHGIQPRWG